MARGKKKEEMSLEEKLEQALVPVEEQPYEVPENWCWVKLESLTDIKTGKKDANYGCEDGKYYFFTCASEPIRCSEYSFEGKAILLAGNGDIGNISLYNGKFEAYQRTYVLEKCRGVIEEYLYYYFKYRWIDYNMDKMFGTAIPYIRLGNLKEYEVPIPPMLEQQRIVEQIEGLFVKLDEVKENAQTVVDGFELRKSAILYKALTGELTKQWRKEYRVELDSWKRCTVGSVCNDIKVGIVIKPSQYYTGKNEGTPAFRSANVRECRVDDLDWVYLNEEGMVNNKRSIVHTGDVLIVRSGNPGTACVVSDMFDGYNAIDILIAVPNRDLILPDFLCLFTNSPLGKKSVAEGKRGMALSHFNVRGYSKVEFNVPLIPEQKEIIRVLNKFLEKEKQAKEAAEAVLDQIDTMKKTILARAFRGELGTNDLAEESAVELLRKIL